MATTASQPVTERAFRVWAPYATRGVDLELNGQRHPMTAAPDCWWRVVVPAVPGDRYGFRIDGGPVLPDPAARSLPDGPDGLAELTDAADRAQPPTDDIAPADPGSDSDPDDDDEDPTSEPADGAEATDPEAAAPDPPPGRVALDNAVCYELRVRRFSAEGTFAGVIDHLDHLADLGVDLILLGPLAWSGGLDPDGYDVRAPLAVDPRYGGRAGLRALVRESHARGIGVGVDLVIGCRNPQGSLLNCYAPYYQAAPDTRSGWAPNLDGPDSDGVRAFWLATARAWLTDFDLDALRLYDAGSFVDRRALTFTEELAHLMAELSRSTGRPRWLIADDDRLDPRTVMSIRRGGLGCDAVPVGDVGRGLWRVVSEPADRAAGILSRVLTDPFWRAGRFSRRHGRVNGRPLDPAAVPGWHFLTGLATPGARPPDPGVVGLRRWCCVVALLLTGATTPVLTMGEEWAARPRTPGPDAPEPAPDASAPDPPRARAPDAPEADGPLDWDAADRGDGPRIVAWYRALLALRTARPDLRDPSLAAIEVRAGTQPGVVVVHRGGHRVAVNLGPATASVDLGLETSHRQVVLLSLDPTTAVTYEGTVDLPPDGIAVVGPASNPGGST